MIVDIVTFQSSQSRDTAIKEIVIFPIAPFGDIDAIGFAVVILAVE